MRDFYQGLENALNEKVGEYIFGLGPLVKSNEFFLALNSREIRDKLIMCGNIVVKDRNFKIRSTDATRFTARVHWAPPFVPNSAIADALGTEFNVEKIVYEMCRGRFRICGNRRTPGNFGWRQKEIASFGKYYQSAKRTIIRVARHCTGEATTVPQV